MRGGETNESSREKLIAKKMSYKKQFAMLEKDMGEREEGSEGGEKNKEGKREIEREKYASFYTSCCLSG